MVKRRAAVAACAVIRPAYYCARDDRRGLLDGEISRTSSDERSAAGSFAYAAAPALPEPSFRPQRNPEFRRAMSPARLSSEGLTTILGPHSSGTSPVPPRCTPALAAVTRAGSFAYHHGTVGIFFGEEACLWLFRKVRDGG